MNALQNAPAIRAKSPDEAFDASAIAARMTETRRKKGLSLEHLADETGISARQLRRYEDGTTPLTDFVVITKIARGLQVSPYALLGSIDVEHDEPVDADTRHAIIVAQEAVRYVPNNDEDKRKHARYERALEVEMVEGTLGSGIKLEMLRHQNKGNFGAMDIADLAFALKREGVICMPALIAKWLDDKAIPNALQWAALRRALSSNIDDIVERIRRSSLGRYVEENKVRVQEERLKRARLLDQIAATYDPNCKPKASGVFMIHPGTEHALKDRKYGGIRFRHDNDLGKHRCRWEYIPIPDRLDFADDLAAQGLSGGTLASLEEFHELDKKLERAFLIDQGLYEEPAGDDDQAANEGSTDDQ